MNKLNEWKHELGEAWGSLAEGWRDLGERASSALTRFRPAQRSAGSEPAPAGPPVEEGPVAGRWAFLAADMFDDDSHIVVRLEAPGMKREDFEIELDDDVLSVRGEKRFERESGRGRYRQLQCAYGSFRRDMRLPVRVRADKARATYRDGVLRVELAKAEGAKARPIAVKVG